MAYSVPNTGGTAAPRGGPTSTEGMKRGGGNVTGGERRYWNTRTGKMETTKQIVASRGMNTRVSAASNVLQRHGGRGGGKSTTTTATNQPARAKSPYVGEAIVDPLGLYSRAQKQAMEHGIEAKTGAEQRATQLPYQQRAQEIGNTQGIVTGKIEGLNTQNNTFMQGLIAGQEGSAKTANNFAAENALSAQKAVETAGQNAITSTGGELSPALRGQLQGQTNLEATQQRGAAGESAMRTLAAAAAAQGQSGLAAARERFAGEEGKNRGQENVALEKIAAKEAGERTELPLKGYADILAQQKLQSSNAIAGEKLAQGRVKLGNEGRRVTTQEQSTANRRRGEEERNATGRRNAQTNWERLGVTERGQNLAVQRGRENNQQRENTNASRERIAAARIKGNIEAAEKRGQKPLTPSVRSKYEKELGAAYIAMENGGREAAEHHQKAPNYGNIRAGLSGGYGTAYGQKGGKREPIKGEKVSNPVIMQAAEDIWRYGKLQASTSAAMERIGLPGSSAGWSNLLRR